jgi:hypothetical protein
VAEQLSENEIAGALGTAAAGRQLLVHQQQLCKCMHSILVVHALQHDATLHYSTCVWGLYMLA